MLFFYSATIAFAVPPGSPYEPGATLDPACAPGDTNCSITVTAAAIEDGIVGVADFSATGTPSASTFLRGDNTWATISGSGTVTSVSVAIANGFGGSVASPTTTPAITITTNVTGLLKGDGTGVAAALAGTDYESPLTFTAPLSRSVNNISIADAAADGTTKGAAAFTAVDFNASSGIISIDYTNGQAASGSNKGFLTAADWTTFNSKQGALTGSVSGTANQVTVSANSNSVASNITVSIPSNAQLSIAKITNLTSNGLIKTSGSDGTLSIATAGTDYQAPITLTTTGSSGAATFIGNTLNIPQYAGGATYTFSTGLTNTSSTITNNLSTGVSGGQTLIGGTGSGDNLTISTTSNGTKGKIIFGSASAYDEVNDRFGITNTAPSAKLHIITANLGVTQSEASGIILQNTTAASAVLQQMSPALILAGNGWKTNATAASQDVRWKIDVLPTSSSSSPISTLQFGSSINGGAYTTPLIVTSAGAATLLGGLTTNGAITASGASISGFTYTATGGTASATNAFNITNSFTATAGTSTGINMSALSYAPTSGTGVFNAFNLSPTINQTGGANGITRGLYIAPTLTAAADFRAIELASADYGNGAAGLIITIGRNTNATNTGAGSINFLSKGGTAGYVWQDNAGNLRIHTAAPTNANDTAGTVVGAQTSTRETKQDIAEYSDYASALQKIVDAPLHTFRYVKEVEGYGTDSPLAKARLGFIADEVDPVFMVGNVIDQVSVNGLLMASIKELDLHAQAIPVFEDKTLAEKIATFLRGIAEQGIAIVDRIKAQRVQTQELCLGDDGDQVCVTKDQLRNLLGQQALSSPPVTTTPPSTSEPTSDPAPTPAEDPVATETEVVPEPQPDPVVEMPAEESVPTPEPAPTETAAIE